MTLDQAIDVAGDCFKIAEKANIRFVMAVGVAFFCPYQGRIEDSVALSVVKRLYEKGIRRLYLAASTGMEDPIHVGRVFKTVTDCWPDIELGFHVHERIGMASANMFAALNSGATSVEGSICGIGGGIAMPNGMGDIGNLPTEDIVNMLETSRIETGIEINSIVQAAKKIEQILDLKCRSFVGRTNSIEN
jgi:hydroxymethylglutaryl-CoA lyase